MLKPMYREVFPKRHTFLPVVHIRDTLQAEENTRIALSEGADGVFLIDHEDRGPNVLLSCYDYVRDCHPDAWIGLNVLGLRRVDAARVIKLVEGVSGLWADSGTDDDFDGSLTNARTFHEFLESTPFRGLYFGGVEFKGRYESSDPGRMARLVAPYMDVVTTSGKQTGEPPSLPKITAMRAAIPEYILGNASGLGPSDVGPYLPYIDCYLAATKISKDVYHFDPPLVRAFANLMEK